MKKSYLSLFIFATIICLLLPSCKIADGNSGYNYNLVGTNWVGSNNANSLAYTIEKNVTENGNTVRTVREGAIGEFVHSIKFSKLEFNKELGVKLGTITFETINRIKEDFTGEIPYDKTTETLTLLNPGEKIFEVIFDANNKYKNLAGQIIDHEIFTYPYSTYVDNNGELCYLLYDEGTSEEALETIAKKPPTAKTLDDGSIEYDFSTCEFAQERRTLRDTSIFQIPSAELRPYSGYCVRKSKNGTTILSIYGNTYELVK